MQILNEKNIEFEEIHYLKNPLNKEQLKDLSVKLRLSPGEFVRKGDMKKLDLTIDLTNNEDVLSNMVAHPKIIERPIIVNGNYAVIGRPAERVLEII